METTEGGEPGAYAPGRLGRFELGPADEARLGDADERGSTGNDPEGPDEMTDLLTALRRSVEAAGGDATATPRPPSTLAELAAVLDVRLGVLRARRTGTGRNSPRLAGQIAEVEQVLLLIGGHR